MWYEDALSFSARTSLEVLRVREASGEWTDKTAGQSQRVGIIYGIFKKALGNTIGDVKSQCVCSIIIRDAGKS